MANNTVDTRDNRAIDVLYEIAEAQAGYLTAEQAIAAGIPRSTLGYHAGDARTLERVGTGVYRLRRFPTAPHGHIVAAWLGLAHADAVVSHLSALEMRELSDLIADEVHVTLPRGKRGLRIPDGVRVHFTTRRVERSRVLGVPVTSVERTIADQVRAAGWTEQIDLAVRQAVQRGLTTRARVEAALPKTWRRRVGAALGED